MRRCLLCLLRARRHHLPPFPVQFLGHRRQFGWLVEGEGQQLGLLKGRRPGPESIHPLDLIQH